VWRSKQELKGVLRALAGEYVLPEAGGDLLRDGAGVLPTGVQYLSFLAQP
jgi:magnesium chelatase subunit H